MNIRFYIINAIILRYFQVFRHDINRIFAILFWPAFDMFLWGFLGAWVQENSTIDFQLAFLSSIALWQMMLRLSQEMANCFLEEVWTQNVINLFVAPIKIIEWLIGLISISIIVGIVVYFNCSIITAFLYKKPFSIFAYNFLIFGPSLFLSGIFLGMIPLILIMKFGRKGAEMAYIITWIVAPFCGVFYPRTVLPSWAQTVGSFLPMTYAFESVRKYILEAVFPAEELLLSYLLSIFYIILGTIIFMYTFSCARKTGLVKLYN
jgi:ABC-2 type transport system permease protein